MKQDNIIYVAIHKKLDYIMSGAKGQTGFPDTGMLRRSIGQSSYKPETGKRVRDMYDIYKVNLDKMTKELVK